MKLCSFMGTFLPSLGRAVFKEARCARDELSSLEMRSSLAVSVVLSFAAAVFGGACAPPAGSKEPVGISDKAEAAPDQSIAGSDGGFADNETCAHSPSLLEGKPCAPEGANCGTPNSDPSQFSNTLTCHGGQWQRVEVAPLPPASKR